MIYSKKNSKGRTFYLHGRGKFYYFSPKKRKGLVTKEEEINNFIKNFKVKELKSGLLYASKK